eukprot:g4245.t1
MAEFVKRTRDETGCIYYGWSTHGDKLFCREAYVDAAAVHAHLGNIGECVGQMLEGPAALDKIELHGPALELEKCKEAMDPLGTAYWEIDQGISFMSKPVGSRAPQTLLTIQPTFTISDWESAEPIMAEFVKRTRDETGCVFYGWNRTANKLFCREAYADAAGVLAHLDNIGDCVGMLLEDEKVATLDAIELHGPAEELAKCKASMDPLGTQYWAIHSGFQNFSM